MKNRDKCVLGLPPLNSRARSSRELPAHRFHRLRAAISEHRGEGLSATASDLLQEICADARRRGVAPEQIIAYVKDEIRSIIRFDDDRDHERTRLERAVTRCIQSFYATAPEQS
jgi:hypothetical protein